MNTPESRENIDVYVNVLQEPKNTSHYENTFLKAILSDFSYYDVIFCAMATLGVTILIIGILYHFYLYESKYVPVKATITEAACDRVIINRRRDEYYCLMTIEYTVDGRAISNTLQTHGSNQYYVGSELTIYVDRDNPINVYIPFISQKLTVLLLVMFGIVILIVASGIRFLRI
jgi:hypothetical protein